MNSVSLFPSENIRLYLKTCLLYTHPYIYIYIEPGYDLDPDAFSIQNAETTFILNFPVHKKIRHLLKQGLALEPIYRSRERERQLFQTDQSACLSACLSVVICVFYRSLNGM